MADNTLQGGSDTIATNDIGGVKHALTKIEFGAAGSATQVSAVAPLPVVALTNGVVSTANSSTANLGASAAFTGTAEDVTEYSSVVVSVFSSHVSATDGLSLQQSPEGTNWDQVDAFTVPAATGKSFSAPVQAKFFRVVYTNAGTITTSFRLQTIFAKQPKKGSSIRPQDARTNDNDFEEMLGYSMAFNGTTWDRVRSSVKGTQGAFALATQDLKDSGRVLWSATSAIAGVTAVTTEALVTMIVQRDGTAIGTATSHTVTSAKRLRITSMTAGLISTGATVLSGRISLRIGAAGAATASSPIVVTLAIPSGAALAQAGGAVNQSFPDGLEFSGAMQIGVSQTCSATSGTIWVNLTGYEY